MKNSLLLALLQDTHTLLISGDTDHYRGSPLADRVKQAIKPSKPPLGVISKSIHDKLRIESVVAAITRYCDAGVEPPSFWIKEVSDYIGITKEL